MEPNQSNHSNAENSPSQLINLSDYTFKIKSLNFAQLYTKGSYLDVYDTSEGIWRVGKVLENNGNTIKINYDGWKSYYDEVFSYFFHKYLEFLYNSIDNLFNFSKNLAFSQ